MFGLSSFSELPFSAQPNNYTVLADTGSYAVTGQAAALVKGWVLTANTGSYAVTGQAATLLRTKALVANTGRSEERRVGKEC